MEKTFQKHLFGQKNRHNKSFERRFILVFGLMDQIRKKTDLRFQEILKKAQKVKLNSYEIRLQNKNYLWNFSYQTP